MTTKDPGRWVFYCSNCGQPVTGKTARIAMDPKVKFCFECAGRLSADGTCQNPGCAFFGRAPIAE